MDVPSYLQTNLTREAISNFAGQTKFQVLAKDLRALFSPLFCSTDFILHPEYSAFQKRLA